MEPEEQIYVNIEELGDDYSAKQQGPEDTETKPVRTGAVATEETETQWPFKGATVFLGLLCFLLLTTAIGVGVLYDRRFDQMSRDLVNHTAERHQLLVRYQNLTDGFVSALNKVTKNIGKCPDGWTRFGCSCYFLSRMVNTWLKSQQACSTQGADLVIIKSQGEMEFLNRFGARLKFWIGLSQSSAQRNWMWTDGTSLGTAYWKKGHPSSNFYRTQTCAAFNSFKATNFELMVKSWSSELCPQFLQWVCEKKAEMSLQ